MAISDRIISVESGGNPNSHNPRSSASGLGQFIDSTWLSMLAKHRPDLTANHSPQELLSLKSDPTLSKQMTDAYAQDNAGVLTSAGLPATPGNTYLAHFAGPQGAVSVLSADPSAPVSSVLGQGAVAANPFLKSMTAGDLSAWANQKMGGPATTPSPSTAAIPASSGYQPPAMPMALASAVQGQQQTPPGTPGQPQGNPMAALMSLMAAPNTPVQPSPMITPPRRPPDLSALQASLPPAPVFGRGFYLRG